MMFDRTSVREGMVVRSSDGEKLGKVFAVGEGVFHIEKGLFFPKDYVVNFSEVSSVRDGEIILSHGREALRSLSSNEKYATTGGSAGTEHYAGTGAGAGVGPGALGATSFGSDRTASGTASTGAFASGTERRLESTGRDEIAVPVAREELEVGKREVSAGEVRVQKRVEEEQVEVPVNLKRERVRVERRSVNPDRPAMSADFRDETIVVPLRAEEAEVSKRAVVSEEVVIHKDQITEERRVADSVRHEEVDVRTSGDVDRRDTDSRTGGYGAPGSNDKDRF